MRDITTTQAEEWGARRTLRSRALRMLAVAVAVACGMFGFASPATAASPSDGFQPGNIISDTNFYNGSAMNVNQVQQFLQQRVPECWLGRPGYEVGKPVTWGGPTKLASKCLKDYRANTAAQPANAYCAGLPAIANETAASVIVRVGKACGISQKVLLVMLDKEQSLVSDPWPNENQYFLAMGYACPDSGPGNSANCDPAQGGFAKQVYRAAWQYKVYRAFPDSYRYKPFQTNTIQWHPNIGCGTSQVYIENWATAALYIYTPYRPNQAALNAGWGTGDGCSSYGNRNFYNYYKAWFGQPNGFEVHAKLAGVYQSIGGTGSDLGRPTGPASVYGTNGVGQGFTNGSMYWSQATGARVVYKGGIREKYWASGSWSGPLGFPNGNVNVYQSGGRGQGFQNGSIYYHPKYGGTIVRGTVRDKYWAVGSVGGTLGYPTGDASTYKDGGIGQGFQNGSIYWSKATGSVYIQNPVRAKYWSLGSISSVLGYPRSDATKYAGGGIGQGFQKGSIYWSAATGAVYVQDPVRAKYWKSGSIDGVLGYPASDPSAYADGGIGQGFQGGSIYWREDVGAVIISGEIRAEYWRQGSIGGALGYPTADAVELPEGGIEQMFQGGKIRITEDGEIKVELLTAATSGTSDKARLEDDAVKQDTEDEDSASTEEENSDPAEEGDVVAPEEKLEVPE